MRLVAGSGGLGVAGGAGGVGVGGRGRGLGEVEGVRRAQDEEASWRTSSPSPPSPPLPSSGGCSGYGWREIVVAGGSASVAGLSSELSTQSARARS